MTNSKNLTGAIALLAFIAVLDNYLIVELEPGFEGMVLIADDGGQAAPPAELDTEEPSLAAFWIDKHEVSNADFAQFVATTGYLPHAETQTIENLTVSFEQELTPGLNEHSKEEVAHAAWEAGISTEAVNSLAKVDYRDALAYCQWQGKRLPSAAHFEFARRVGQRGAVYYESLHAYPSGDEMRRQWIATNHRGVLVDGAVDAAGNHPLSNSSRSGFLCVKDAGPS